MIGDLPEVVEQEIEGEPIPVAVPLPVTINGRVFPREDIDVWTFPAEAGQTITCSVVAQALGSPLETRLEVYDPRGQSIADAVGGLNPDPQVRFQTKLAGNYSVHVGDARSSGGPQFVYRLTVASGAWLDRIYPLGGQRGKELAVEIAGCNLPNERLSLRLPDVPPGIVSHSCEIAGKSLNAIRCDIDELPEQLETAAGALTLEIPGIANGRIESPGNVDAWSFLATKGSSLKFELRAARLGSPLDGTLVIKNAEGKELARAEDFPNGSPDCEMEFKVPADGSYTISVSDRFASRGGPAFAYRLRATYSLPDFQVTIATDVLIVDIGGEKKLPVQVQRLGSFVQPIKLAVEGLPPGVTVAEVAVPANQNRAELVFKLEKEVPVHWPRVQIIGRAEGDGQTYERRASIALPTSEPTHERLLLACGLPTPFRFQADYQLRYIARGGTLKKTFHIDRQGFTGPLEVQLADRQGRHLQGVKGPTLAIPPEASEFEFEVQLPPWMELGRTSRANLMLTGELNDASGKPYKVCFTTSEQNEQLIAIVSPAPLRLSLEKTLLIAKSDHEATLLVRIHRDRALTGDCRLELAMPNHMQHIAAVPVVVPANSDVGEFKIQFGAQPGPFNAPLTIRGTVEKDGSPVTAEVALECLLPRNAKQD